MDSEAERARLINQRLERQRAVREQARKVYKVLSDPGRILQSLYDQGKSSSIEPMVFFATKFTEWTEYLRKALDAKIGPDAYLISEDSIRSRYEAVLSERADMAESLQNLVSLYEYYNNYYTDTLTTLSQDAVLQIAESFAAQHNLSLDHAEMIIKRAAGWEERLGRASGESKYYRYALQSLKSIYVQNYKVPYIIHATLSGSSSMPMTYYWRLQPGQRIVQERGYYGKPLPSLPEGINFQGLYYREDDPVVVNFRKKQKEYAQQIATLKKLITKLSIHVNRYQTIMSKRELDDSRVAFLRNILHSHPEFKKEIAHLIVARSVEINLDLRHSVRRAKQVIDSFEKRIEQLQSELAAMRPPLMEDAERAIEEYNKKVHQNLIDAIRRYTKDPDLDIFKEKRGMVRVALPVFTAGWQPIVPEHAILKMMGALKGTETEEEIAAKRKFAQDFLEQNLKMSLRTQSLLSFIAAKPEDAKIAYVPPSFVIRSRGMARLPLKQRKGYNDPKELFVRLGGLRVKGTAYLLKAARISDVSIKEIPPEEGDPGFEEYMRFKQTQEEAAAERENVLRALYINQYTHQSIPLSYDISHDITDRYTFYARDYTRTVKRGENYVKEVRKVRHWRNKKTGKFAKPEKDITDKHIRDLTPIIKSMLTANYFKKGVGVKSGYLLKAIQQGSIKKAKSSTESGTLNFEFAIDNIIRPARANEGPNQAPPTTRYATYVTNGRGFVFSEAYMGTNSSRMLRFGPTDPYVELKQMILSYWVRPSRPKNIFEMDQKQQETIGHVIGGDIMSAWIDTLGGFSNIDVDGLVMEK